MPNELISPSASEYRSYLLRLWRGDQESVWHAAVESVGDRERHSFATLEELIAFLRDETRHPPDSEDS